jgi:hypothetical protein
VSNRRRATHARLQPQVVTEWWGRGGVEVGSWTRELAARFTALSEFGSKGISTLADQHNNIDGANAQWQFVPWWGFV